jgi:mono/diheme cytochrome c family protein
MYDIELDDLTLRSQGAAEGPAASATQPSPARSGSAGRDRAGEPHQRPAEDSIITDAAMALGKPVMSARDCFIARRLLTSFSFAAALCLEFVATSVASAAGNPEAGWQLARRWCTSCHVVDEAGQGTDMAPAFPTIAREHARDEKWLRGWLMAPHPPMPNMSLSRGEIDDVIAYLKRLAAQ